MSASNVNHTFIYTLVSPIATFSSYTIMTMVKHFKRNMVKYYFYNDIGF